MRVVILDGFLSNFDGIDLSIGDHERVWYPATAPEQIAERIAGADAVLTSRATLTGELMAGCPTLRYIGTLGTGYNMVDLAAASQRGIVVCNAPGYSTNAVAQGTFALLLEIAGKISVYDRIVREGGWRKGAGRALVSVPTHELAGKTMGIFGLGEIGGAVGKIAAAFGMEVLGYRRNPPAERDGSVRLVDVDTLLRESDVLSIHCPLNAETARFFDAGTIGAMKDGAVLLNTARGGILDEAAVAAALDSGKLSAFGADVLTNEPPEEGNPLVGHPKTVITPHITWLPRETRERMLAVVSENLLAFLAGKPRNVVNP